MSRSNSWNPPSASPRRQANLTSKLPRAPISAKKSKLPSFLDGGKHPFERHFSDNYDVEDSVSPKSLKKDILPHSSLIEMKSFSSSDIIQDSDTDSKLKPYSSAELQLEYLEDSFQLVFTLILV